MPPVTDSFPNFSGRALDNGRYSLMNMLGAGAYGKVYKAIDNNSPTENPTYVAIKCLQRPQPGSRQEEFQLREFALHEKVSDHPHIVTLHKVFYDDTYVYVVLDLIEGGDLFSQITERKIFVNNNALVKKAFVQILDALQHCHEQSVFHRDLKPENILCAKAGTHLYLADFGLCTYATVSQDFGCGSSYYMSPECIGKEFKHARFSTRHSDIWSLGVILTNMISGRNPWRYAMMTDACFSAFLHDKDFLRTALPISEPASLLLTRIFTLNPLSRISIPQLKKEILEMDTFFKTEAEQAAALPPINPPRRPITKAARIKVYDDDSTASSGEAPGNSPEQVYVCLVPRNTPSSSLPQQPKQATLAPRACDPSSSETDSGPVTPATHAVEPDVEVPDINLGQAIDEGIRHHVVAFQHLKIDPKAPRHRSPSSANDKAPPRQSRFLKRAVKRLKAIPGSSSS